MTPIERETFLIEVNVALLEARGISCPDDVRARIQSCEDPTTLRAWLLRSTAASTAADLFKDDV